jgi:methionyl-tRNA formyltransferase
MSLKVVFMGTPEFSIPSLEYLIKSKHNVVCVYTQPSKKKSRGQKIQKTPVHIFSEKNGINVRTSKLTDENELTKFTDLKPDLVIVVAYGQIIPSSFLQISNLNFLNVHASLLPKWRGAAPIERAILNGDKETGVSIMKIEKKLDAGPYIMQSRIKIDSETNSGELKEKLSILGAKSLIQSIDLILSKEGSFIDQNDKEASYAKKIEKEESKINWQEDAEKIILKINAFSPKPGAWFYFNKLRIKIHKAKIVNLNGKPGTVLDDKLTIATKKNAIKILKLQKEGKNIIEATDFLKGNKVNKNIILN